MITNKRFAIRVTLFGSILLIAIPAATSASALGSQVGQLYIDGAELFTFPAGGICTSSAEQHDQFGTPRRVYTATEIAQMFKKPTTALEFLENLKLVMDTHLLVQPAFYSDSTLMRLVDGAKIRWEPKVPTFVPGGTSQDAVVVVSAGMLPKMRVVFRRAYTPVAEHRGPNGHYVRAHTQASGSISIAMNSDEFTLDAVKRVFGPNPGRPNDTVALAHAPGIYSSYQGVIFYDGSTGLPSEAVLETNRATFNVAQDDKVRALSLSQSEK